MQLFSSDAETWLVVSPGEGQHIFRDYSQSSSSEVISL